MTCRYINTLVVILITLSLSCSSDRSNKKDSIYMQLLPKLSITYDDVCGYTWLSDEYGYYLTFNRNGTCILSNYPRKLLYGEMYYNAEEKNDTTRIILFGKWEISNDDVLIFYNIESDKRRKYDRYDSVGTKSLSLSIKHNPFGGEERYIPYYETMDDDENVFFHTFSVVEKKSVPWKGYHKQILQNDDYGEYYLYSITSYPLHKKPRSINIISKKNILYLLKSANTEKELYLYAIKNGYYMADITLGYMNEMKNRHNIESIQNLYDGIYMQKELDSISSESWVKFRDNSEVLIQTVYIEGLFLKQKFSTVIRTNMGLETAYDEQPKDTSFVLIQILLARETD